jgi:hypothetical protein
MVFADRVAEVRQTLARRPEMAAEAPACSSGCT